MKAQHAVTINRPIDEVFDVATCMRRCVVWQTTAVSSEQTSDSPIGVGSTFRHEVRFLAKTVRTNPVVTAYDRPHLFAYADKAADTPFEARFSFEPTADGTQFSVVVEAETTSVFQGLASPILALLLKRQYSSDMNCLKDLLENNIDLDLLRADRQAGLPQ